MKLIKQIFQKATILVLLCLCLSSAEYNESKAREYIYAAALAYCPSELVMTKACNDASKMAENYNIVPVHSLGNQGGSNIIIGFSGTIGITQLVTEILEAYPVAYKLHDVNGGLVFDYFYAHYVNSFRDDVLNKTQEITQKYPSYKLVFVGHSLGGALTIHAAADIILSGLANHTDVVVYTYGQPRVGDSKFNEAWMPKVKEFFRLVHNRDLVSHIPPCLRGISASCIKDGILPIYPYHVTQEIFYDQEFQVHVICSDTDGEDMLCSNKIFNTSIDDHTHYFGIEVGQLHKHNETEGIQNIFKIKLCY